MLISEASGASRRFKVFLNFYKNECEKFRWETDDEATDFIF
jgi:hypothetical protein